MKLKVQSLSHGSHFSSTLVATVEEGNGTPLQYSCLENSTDGGAWKATVHGVAEGQTGLSDFTFTSLSCIGEGNGKPLQCSCLENPRDGGAWWAAVYGVAQSGTQLKRLSSSSSSGYTWQMLWSYEGLTWVRSQALQVTSYLANHQASILIAC